MDAQTLAPVLPGHRVLDELVLLEVLGLATAPKAGRPHLHPVLRALVPRELLVDRPPISRKPPLSLCSRPYAASSLSLCSARTATVASLSSSNL